MAKIGALVRIDAKNKNAFQYVTDLSTLDVIGTIAQGGFPGSLCLINLIGSGGTSDPPWSSITGKPNTVAGYGITDALGNEFETISKNLKNYPYVLTYGVDGIDTITYDLSGGLSITKTFHYTDGVLTSLVLSGNTPAGINLTKIFSYIGADLTGVAYS